MPNTTLMRAVPPVLAGLVLAACAQYSPEMPRHTIAYNRAVARSTNQLLFLNIIRASEREPRYFTRIDNNQANANFTPSLTLTFPFDKLSGGSAELNPSGTTGNSLTLQNMDDSKYQIAANAPISVDTIEYYWDAQFQREMLGMLFFDTIQIPTEELATLQSVARKHCEGKACNLTDVDLAKCTVSNLPDRDGKAYTTFSNNPANDDTEGVTGLSREECFRAALMTLLGLGLRPDEITSKKTLQSDLIGKLGDDPHFVAEIAKLSYKFEKDKGKNTYSIIQEKKSTEFVLDAVAAHRIADEIHGKSELVELFSKDDQRTLEEIVTAPEPKARAASDFHIKLGIRSFESLVYFLGEVVRAEVSKPAVSDFSLPVRVRQNWGDPNVSFNSALFVVRKGDPEGKVALVVDDDHGNTFWIPDICADLPTLTRNPPCTTEYPNHQSMTVMTIVNQLWGLQKEPAAAQSPIHAINVGG